MIALLLLVLLVLVLLLLLDLLLLLMQLLLLLLLLLQLSIGGWYYGLCGAKQDRGEGEYRTLLPSWRLGGARRHSSLMKLGIACGG